MDSLMFICLFLWFVWQIALTIYVMNKAKFQEQVNKNVAFEIIAMQEKKEKENE